MDSDGNCHEVDDQCKCWNDLDGSCTKCYEGYTLNNGKCQIGGEEEIPTVDPAHEKCRG